MIKGKQIKKVTNEIKKYFIFTPANHKIINPLKAISTDVPRSSCDKTKIIGTIMIERATIILVKEFMLSILILTSLALTILLLLQLGRAITLRLGVRFQLILEQLEPPQLELSAPTRGLKWMKSISPLWLLAH